MHSNTTVKYIITINKSTSMWLFPIIRMFWIPKYLNVKSYGDVNRYILFTTLKEFERDSYICQLSSSFVCILYLLRLVVLLSSVWPAVGLGVLKICRVVSTVFFSCVLTLVIKGYLSSPLFLSYSVLVAEFVVSTRTSISLSRLCLFGFMCFINRLLLVLVWILLRLYFLLNHHYTEVFAKFYIAWRWYMNISLELIMCLLFPNLSTRRIYVCIAVHLLLLSVCLFENGLLTSETET